MPNFLPFPFLELNMMLVKVVSKVNQKSISRPCYTFMLRSDITWINVMVLGGYKLIVAHLESVHLVQSPLSLVGMGASAQ